MKKVIDALSPVASEGKDGEKRSSAAATILSPVSSSLSNAAAAAAQHFQASTSPAAFTRHRRSSTLYAVDSDEDVEDLVGKGAFFEEAEPALEIRLPGGTAKSARTKQKTSWKRKKSSVARRPSSPGTTYRRMSMAVQSPPSAVPLKVVSGGGKQAQAKTGGGRKVEETPTRHGEAEAKAEESPPLRAEAAAVCKSELIAESKVESKTEAPRMLVSQKALDSAFLPLTVILSVVECLDHLLASIREQHCEDK